MSAKNTLYKDDTLGITGHRLGKQVNATWLGLHIIPQVVGNIQIILAKGLE